MERDELKSFAPIWRLSDVAAVFGLDYKSAMKAINALKNIRPELKDSIFSETYEGCSFELIELDENALAAFYQIANLVVSEDVAKELADRYGALWSLALPDNEADEAGC